MRWVLFLGLAVVLMLAMAHHLVASRPTDAAIRLDSKPLASAAHNAAELPHLRIAVAPMLTPGYSFTAYQVLGEYLAAKLQSAAELVYRSTYAQINALLAHDEVDVAFIFVGNYVSAPEAMDLLAASVIDGKAEYYGLIIVPATSAVKTLAELRGKRFLFTDRDSVTGYAYAARRVRQLASQAAKDFFGTTNWSEGHNRSIQGVAWGLADGAAVSSMAYDAEALAEPDLVARVRIIERSEPYPTPPVAVRKSLPAEERQRLLKALLELPKTASGQQILKSLGMDCFVPVKIEDYQRLQRPQTEAHD